MTDQTTPAPLTDEQLEQIRARAAEPPHLPSILLKPWEFAYSDRDLLLAEVDRLRAQLAEIRQAVTEIEQCSTHDAAGHAETDARARHGSAPITLAQAAGHLHGWAGDLADGARTDWPAGHPDIIQGIRAAADWLDARAAYEAKVREQQAAAKDALDWLLNHHSVFSEVVDHFWHLEDGETCDCEEASRV